VALDDFRNKPVLGYGAGTFELQWERHRAANFDVTDGHSLYLEGLSELGAVGIGLLAVALVGLLLVLGVRCRGVDRTLFGAILAVTVAWMVHAGIDWDWEQPAVTVGVLALAAGALSNRGVARIRRADLRPWIRVAVCVALALAALIPLRIAMSQARLDDSLRARKEGDCTRSVASARSAISDLDVRPEPFEALGYCASKLGAHRLAIASLKSAAQRDPQSWKPRYGLALVRAAARLDPRPALAAARRRNPRSMLIRDLGSRFKKSHRTDWPRIARGSPLPPQ
jgi:O-antigen ligase